MKAEKQQTIMESDFESNRDTLKAESTDYFVSFVQMFGLPKSIGQIYGLLFVWRTPVSMDDIVKLTGISKGSASQGLSLLKDLGAVKSIYLAGDRREHFIADLNVSRIVNHFFENRLRPRLENGDERLERMLRITAEISKHSCEADDKEIEGRVKALRKWQKRGLGVLPLLMKWLKL